MTEQTTSIKKGKITLLTYIATATLLIGSTTQSITLPFWITSFGDNIGGPYFIVCWASFIFTIVFLLIFSMIRLFKQTKIVSIKKYMKNYIIQGITNCMNGIFVVYSAPIKRTPPILFLVIGSSNIFFSILFTKLIVKNKKYQKYMAWKPIISMCLTISAIIVMFVGKFVTEINQSHFKWESIFWIVTTTIGTAFGSLYNVLQEQYLTISKKELDTELEKKVNMFVILFWTSLYQFLFMVIFFWVDIMPIFGFTKIDTFIPNIKNSFGCFFGRNDCRSSNALWGIGFASGYVITYISNIVLNADSANYANYITTLNTPLASIVFYITKLGTETTPLWSIIPALLCVFIGMFIWKYWEEEHKHDNDKLPIIASKL